MNIQFPFHTAAWIVLNMIMLGVLITGLLNQSFSRNAISPKAKLKWLTIVIAFLITWFVARLLLGHSRLIAPARLIPLSFLVLNISVTLALIFSPIFRQAALSIPQSQLIGMHVVRVAGFVFLALLDMRLLPAQFALPAGYGDIIVALTAPLAVYALKHNKRFGREIAISWNFLGLLDFAIALVTGTVFIGPHVRQLAQTGHPIAYLDYVLMIPGFAVPILVLMHVNSLFGLLKGQAARGIPNLRIQGLAA
jgi:hypothetical protein